MVLKCSPNSYIFTASLKASLSSHTTVPVQPGDRVFQASQAPCLSGQTLAEFHLIWLRGYDLPSIYGEPSSKLWGSNNSQYPHIFLWWFFEVESCILLQDMLLAAEKLLEQASQFKVSHQCLCTCRPTMISYAHSLGWSQILGRPVPLSLRGSRTTSLVPPAQWGSASPAWAAPPPSNTSLPSQALSYQAAPPVSTFLQACSCSSLWQK